MSSSTAEKAIASIAASDELVLPPGSDDDAQNEGQLPAPCRDPDLADLSIWKTMALVGAVCLSVFLIALDYSIVTTAIPKITDRFGSINDIGWYGSAYFLASVSFQPTFGKIYQVFNVKRSFIIALIFFELGSLLCGIAPSSKVLIVGRAIEGIGDGGIFAGSFTILASTVSLRRRSLALGCVSAMFGVASVAGPVLGGLFTDQLSWRWCFLINLPIGAVSAAVIIFVLRSPPPTIPTRPFFHRVKDIDPIGGCLLCPSVVCLLLALQWGGSEYPWSNPRVVGLFVVFAVLLFCFVAIQLYLGDKATIPPRFFRIRQVTLSWAFSVVFGGSYFTFSYYLPIYFQSVKDTTATNSGIDTIPLLFTSILSSILIGAFVSAVGYYTPFVIFGMAIFCAGCGLMTTFNLDTPFRLWFGFELIAGIGLGAGFGLPQLAVQTVISKSDVPVGTTLCNFFFALGGTLCVSAAQAIFQNELIAGIHKRLPSLNPGLLLNVGATEIRGVLLKENLESTLSDVLASYVQGIRGVLRLTLACAVFAFLIACCWPWNSVKRVAGGEEMSLQERATQTMDTPSNTERCEEADPKPLND